MAGEAGEDNETVDSTTPVKPGIDPTVDHVMSEVHLGCPPHFSHSYISHFTFSGILPFPSLFLIYGLGLFGCREKTRETRVSNFLIVIPKPKSRLFPLVLKTQSTNQSEMTPL